MRYRTIGLGIWGRSVTPWSVLIMSRLALAADSAPNRELPTLSIERLSIVMAMVILMTVLFVILFYWQKRIEQAGYFASIYQDTIKNVEYNRLAAGYQQRWAERVYINEILHRRSLRGAEWADHHPKEKPTPELVELAKKLNREVEVRDIQWSMSVPRFDTGSGGGRNPFADDFGGMTSQSSTEGLGGSGGFSAGDSPDDKAFRDMKVEFKNAASAWSESASSVAWNWYQADLEKADKRARRQAKRALQVDFSALRGRGPEFALEFTAIVVIIFAAVILGVVGLLTGEQVGTLLAAIAGYVLGKGAARGRAGQQLEVSVKTPEGQHDTTHPGAALEAAKPPGTAPPVGQSGATAS